MVAMVAVEKLVTRLINLNDQVVNAILVESDLDICLCPIKGCRGYPCKTNPCYGRYHNGDSSAKMSICSDCQGR